MNNIPSEDMPQREVFILRLWRRKDHPTGWQAQVQHIGSGRTTQVHNYSEMQDWIDQQIALCSAHKAALDESAKSGLK